jgi:hypothetical protein
MGTTSTTTMEALFRPTTRYRDSHRNRRRVAGSYTEVELLPGLTVEHVLATGVTWEDFYNFLQGKVIWMAPDVYICSAYMVNTRDPVFDPLIFVLGDDSGNTSMRVRVTEGTAFAIATATCDFLLRLFSTSEQHDVYIRGRPHSVPPRPPLSGAGLSLFFQESQICLGHVWFSNMTFNEDQCRSLATMSRLDVELNISSCSLLNGAAGGAFVECLHSDRGPIQLIRCEIDSHVLANALTGDSRVTVLKHEFVSETDADKGVLFRALANNRGLKELDLDGCSINDENWSILAESLKAHPTLTSLNLRDTRPGAQNGEIIEMSTGQRAQRIEMSTGQRAQRTRVLAEMMEENIILHTITSSGNERDEQIYAERIHPYLETNLYRPRVLGIKKADIELRRPLLALALQTESVRNKSNFLWMFLSGNSDILV